MKHNLI